MKKIIVILCSILCVCIGYAQDKSICHKTEKVDGVLYVVENGERFRVFDNIVLVKPIKPIQEIERDIKITKTLEFGFAEVEVPRSTDIVQYIDRLKESKYFEIVEFITECKLLSVNSTQETEYHALFLDSINIYNAWAITTGSPSVRVGVVDSGIEREHEDIGYGVDGYTNISYTLGYDYVNSTLYTAPSYGHGTHVAGIIGAKAYNSRGVAGISGGNNTSGVTLLSYRIYKNEGDTFINMGTAINRAVNEGAKVINISLTTSSNSYIASCLQSAYNAGTSIVCATGNNGQSSLSFPASDTHTIAVGGIQLNNHRWTDGAHASNYGTGIDLVAPVFGIKTTDINNDYNSLLTGTSLAAPQVAGTIALMLSLDSTLTPSEIRDILRKSAKKIPYYTSYGWHQEVGYGKLDVYEVLKGIFEIKGPSLICTSATYRVDRLPSDFQVSWSYHPANTAPHPILTMNTPSVNQCTISNTYHYPYDGTLTANIYHGNQLVFTLTKHVVSLSNDNISATYSQKACGYYNVSHPAIPEQTITNASTTFVHQGCQVVVESPWFSGRTVSYSGCTPESWLYDGNETVTFSLPLGSGGIPFHILAPGNGEGGCNCNIDLLFFSYSNNSKSKNNLDMELSGKSLNLTLSPNSEFGAISGETPEKTDISWEIEIFCVNPVKKVYHSITNHKSITLDVSKWEKGIYIVNATIDEEKISNKFVIE